MKKTSKLYLLTQDGNYIIILLIYYPVEAATITIGPTLTRYFRQRISNH